MMRLRRQSVSLGALLAPVTLFLVLCYPVAFCMSRLPERWRLVFLFLKHAAVFASRIVRLSAAVDNLAHARIRASLDLEVSRVQTFVKVLPPQTLHGIVGGAVTIFIPSVGSFILPDGLGGAKGLMTGNPVEQQFLSARNWPFGSALSVIIMTVVVTALMVALTRAKQHGGAYA